MALPFILIGVGVAVVVYGSAHILAAFSGKTVVIYGHQKSGKTEFVNGIYESLGKNTEIKKGPTANTDIHEKVTIETDKGKSLYFSEIRDMPGRDTEVNEFLKAVVKDNTVGMYFLAGYVPDGSCGNLVRFDERPEYLKRVRKDLKRSLKYLKDQQEQRRDGTENKLLLVITHCDLDPDSTEISPGHYMDQFSKIVHDKITKVHLPLVAGSLCDKKSRKKLVKLSAENIDQKF